MKQAGGRLSSPAGPVRAAAFEAHQDLEPSPQHGFEDVALVHLDRLYQMAVRLCRNRTEAEDLVQETYLRAFRHFDQFKPGTNCRAWLFAILHHTFTNCVKRGGWEVLEFDESKLEGAESGPSELTRPSPTQTRSFFGT